ncbi:hypothetical protein COL154_014345, partial [Colletotrichum chrysophilum]
KGQAWRLGGKEANKHNPWQDLMACGEDLIARGITSKDKLFIIGGSAGGITMGRAMTERPHLFAGVLDLVPAARVAHIGLYRDHETLEAVEYFFKAPSDLADRLIIVVDPMLATANSAIAAIDKLKARGATNIRFLCLLAAPEGIERFTKAHPDVPVFTASIDRGLNERGYIMPGLGDAGDRMYGTK